MIDQLHFVRPDWFYAFIPLAIFIVLMFRRHGTSMGWKSVCDAQLLPHILTQPTGKSSRFPLLLVAVATSISIIAAAGPVFEKVQQPVFREQSALVVILDLSQSMDATDLRPSRIERAKMKLLDILKSRKGGQTALIVYAANAFTVTPLTDDTKTIANLIPPLKTELMPTQGSRAYIAINKAIELLKQAGVNKGDALLMTDGVTAKDNEVIAQFSALGHRLSILGIGTTDGGPVPLGGGFLQDANGAIVIPKLKPQQLQKAALEGGGMYASMQADDSDIKRLGELFTSNKMKVESDTPTLGALEITADIWQEEGPWLLLLVIPIAALWSRKGWLLSLPLLVLSLPEPSYALDMNNLWSSRDQKAMRAFNEGDANTAAEQFGNQRWKSAALYRAGNYEKALDALNEAATSDDFYNKGNTLAQMGRFPEAIKAYDEAINLDANNEDAAHNRELVKKELQKQQNDQPSDQQQQDGQQQDGQSQDDQAQDQQQSSENDSESSDKNQQQSDASSQDKNSDDKQNQQAQQQDSNKPSENNRPDEQSQSEQDKSEADVKQALQDAQKQEEEEKQEQATDKDNTDNKEENEAMAMSEPRSNENLTEDEQATEQWLKRIPDDPGQLLRRKFLYQYKNMQNQTTDEKPW